MSTLNSKLDKVAPKARIAPKAPVPPAPKAKAPKASKNDPKAKAPKLAAKLGNKAAPKAPKASKNDPKAKAPKVAPKATKVKAPKVNHAEPAKRKQRVVGEGEYIATLIIHLPGNGSRSKTIRGIDAASHDEAMGLAPKLLASALRNG